MRKQQEIYSLCPIRIITNYPIYFQKMAAEREGGGSGSGSSEKTEEGKQAEEPKKEDKQ